MSWNRQTYADHVRKHAPAGMARELLAIDARQFDKSFPNVFAAYYSMPDWLEIFDLHRRLEQGAPFSAVIAEYRHAAGKYHEKLKCVLGTISIRRSGQALLRELASQRHRVTIMPYWHYGVSMPGSDHFNATVKPLPGKELSELSDGFFETTSDAYEKGQPSRNSEGELEGTIKGTGKGSGAAVFFSPEIWESQNRGPGSAPDEVLYHELVHVTRMLRGQMTFTPVTGEGGYGNVEEFMATVITNIYISERGKPLRGSYGFTGNQPIKHVEINGVTVMHVHAPRPSGWNVMADPEKFYQNPQKTKPSPRELVQMLLDKQPTFYRDLSQLPDGMPKFNPVKQHFKENQKIDI
jgi:hypothetical protein